MRDKRPVDELSIEELERILAIRKREARMARMQRYEGTGRRIAAPVNDADDANDADLDELEAGEPAEVEVAPELPVPVSKVEYDDGAPQFEDELDARKRGVTRSRNPNLTKVWWNRLLLVVEVAAALGLVFLVVSVFQSLQEVTQASAQIQAQYQATANARIVPPTATPIIGVKAVVLPTGHTVSVNGSQVVAAFNLDEVPAQYRDQYRALITQPVVAPTVSPEGPIRIQIPKLKVSSAVVSGDSWQVLQLGVGHHLGSANPGERGNMVLSAHNDVYGETFRYLDQLQKGDQIIVSTTTRGDYTYVVQDRQIVRPDDVWVMDSRGDDKQVTLISCYPYRQDNRRIVVFATLQP